MTNEQQTRVAALIERLGLECHPEGGRFRQVYKSSARVDVTDGRAARAAMTTIYYMLEEGEVGRWHRVRSDEVWHFYEGDALELLVAPPDLSRVERRRLSVVGDGEGPVTIVPADWWQAARPLGAFALVGCTVAPGFEFEDFAFLSDAPEAARLASWTDADRRLL